MKLRLRVSKVILLVIVLGIYGCASSPGEKGPFLMDEVQSLEVGVESSGVLSRSAPINANDGSTYRVFEMISEPGGSLAFQATGDELEPRLSLFAPDGTYLGSSEVSHQNPRRASLVRRLHQPEPHLVIVSGARAGEYGSFQLIVDPIEDAPALSVPSEVEHLLYDGERTRPDSDAAMNVHPLTVDEDTVVEVRMMSGDFDAFLMVVDAITGTVLAVNDDWGGTTDSRIVIDLPAGEYEVWASAFQRSSYGTYTVTVDPLEIEQTEEFVVGEPYHSHLGPQRQAIPGTTRSGYPLEIAVEEPMILNATMRSEDLDSYLVLTDDTGRLITEDDDSGGGLDAQIVISLEPGDYTLWATSLREEETGRFLMETELIDGAVTTGGGEALTLGSSVRGILTPSDQTYPPRQTHIQYHELHLSSDADLQIDLRSTEFDVYLVLEDESGNLLAENDDAHPGTTDARIETNLRAGTYRLGVTAFDITGFGAFDITVTETDSTDQHTL